MEDHEEDITSAHSPSDERREVPQQDGSSHESTGVSARGSTTQREDDDITLAALASTSSLHLPGADDDQQDLTSPSFLLVAALRSQITDLSSQVTSLNSKLVTSYTKIGDLEDEVHDSTERTKSLQSQTAELQRAKQTWEAAIDGGSYIESVRSFLSSRFSRLLLH